MDVTIYPLNNESLTVSFGDEIDPEIHVRVKVLYQKLQRETFPWMIDIVPTYTNVTVYFDSGKIHFSQVKSLLIDRLKRLELTKGSRKKLIKIPVYYNGEDLERVAELNDITVDEVITIHSSTPYLVYMIGFLPGFPYLGGLDEKLATPRLDSPRKKVDAGSVGIAGQQTGMYPIDSPGGWNIIGHSPVRLFDMNRSTPFLVNIGDYLQFEPINLEKYEHYNNEQNYEPTWEWLSDED
ncbi:5-oxoprolinase subunit PxpB [Piscibacillus sp. B03]|uniref:5-oxoprolinase subunit PxpB n=1 Tax=Piscibacillus sp. B03 TaxID=3457430 RepID=UPI003FCDF3D5